MKNLFRIALALLAVIPLAGLTAAAPAGPAPAKPAAVAAALAPAAAQVADYTLQVGDTIAVNILGEEAMSKQMSALKITPDHTITVTFFEDAPVNVSGKSRRDLEKIITNLYKPDYLKKPQISVMVVSYAPRKVNVLGKVVTPREVPFPPEKGLKLIEAITQAGGPTAIASLKNIALKRTLPDGTVKTYKNIDARPLIGITQGNAGTDDWPLMPDDVIYVDEISLFGP